MKKMKKERIEIEMINCFYIVLINFILKKR